MSERPTEEQARALAARVCRASIFGDAERNAACNAALEAAGEGDRVPLFTDAEVAKHVDRSWRIIADMVADGAITLDGVIL